MHSELEKLLISYYSANNYSHKTTRKILNGRHEIKKPHEILCGNTNTVKATYDDLLN